MDRDKSRTRPESDVCETPDRWPWFISYKVVAFFESVRSFINRHETGIQFYEGKHTCAEQMIEVNLSRLEARVAALEERLKRGLS